MKGTITFAVAFLPILTACTPAEQASDPVSIVNSSYELLNDKDIDAYMELVAEDAVFIDPTARYVGKDAIQEHLQQVWVDSLWTNEITNLRADGGKVTYSYTFLSGGGVFTSGDDGFSVVVDGKLAFDGTKGFWTLECSKDASQRFCD